MLALIEGSSYTTQNLRLFFRHSTGMRLASVDQGSLGSGLRWQSSEKQLWPLHCSVTYKHSDQRRLSQCGPHLEEVLAISIGIRHCQACVMTHTHSGPVQSSHPAVYHLSRGMWLPKFEL